MRSLSSGRRKSVLAGLTWYFRIPPSDAKKVPIKRDVIILGRGASLDLIPHFDGRLKDISNLITCNPFWSGEAWGHPQGPSLAELPYINNILRQKNVILVRSPLADIKLIKPFLRKYKVAARYQTTFNHTIRIKKPMRHFENLPDELIDPLVRSLALFPKLGTMSLAVLLAKHLFGARNFFIFGLDFYEEDYIVPMRQDYEQEKREAPEMKESWIKFMRGLEDCHFNVFTKAALESQANIAVRCKLKL
jgi:hypothetical protein